MADSIREQILQALAARLATITTANGYDVNIKTVERARRLFVISELPACGIFDTTELLTPHYNAYSNVVAISVELHSDAVAENRSMHANKLLASLKKGVMSGDDTFGGIAERTIITETTINYPQDDDESLVSVSVIYSVTYEEVAGDPYNNP